MTALHDLSAVALIDGYRTKSFSPTDVMRAVIGRGNGRTAERPGSEWVEELRGPIELP